MQAPVFFLRGIIHNDVKKLVQFTYTVVKNTQKTLLRLYDMAKMYK